MYRHHMIPSYYTGLSTLAQRQGVEEAIRFNSYKFDNIKSITWGGQDYVLDGQAILKTVKDPNPVWIETKEGEEISF